MTLFQASTRIARVCRPAALILLLLAAAAALHAQPVKGKHVEAELVADVTAIEPGKPFTAALRLRMEDGWHTYWMNSGDAGMPTVIEWTELPAGVAPDSIVWPCPVLLGEPPYVSYGYEGEILLPIRIVPPKDLASGSRATFAATAKWLVCNEDLCLSGQASLTLTLPVARRAAADRRWSPAIAKTLAGVPKENRAWHVAATADGDDYVLTIAPAAGSKLQAPERADFFPAVEGVIDHSAEQTVERIGGALRITLKRSPFAAGRAERIGGVLYTPGAWDRAGKLHAIAFDVPVGTTSD